MKSHLNAAQVARLLHVDRATIARWIDKGILRGAIRVPGAKEWIIPFSAYEALDRKIRRTANQEQRTQP